MKETVAMMLLMLSFGSFGLEILAPPALVGVTFDAPYSRAIGAQEFRVNGSLVSALGQGKLCMEEFDLTVEGKIVIYRFGSGGNCPLEDNVRVIQERGGIGLIAVDISTARPGSLAFIWVCVQTLHVFDVFLYIQGRTAQEWIGHSLCVHFRR